MMNDERKTRPGDVVNRFAEPHHSSFRIHHSALNKRRLDHDFGGLFARDDGVRVQRREAAAELDEFGVQFEQVSRAHGAAKADLLHAREGGALARGEHDATYRFERQGTAVDFPAWDVQGRIIWGMTYRLLTDLVGLIQAGPSTPA